MNLLTQMTKCIQSSQQPYEESLSTSHFRDEESEDGMPELNPQSKEDSILKSPGIVQCPSTDISGNRGTVNVLDAFTFTQPICPRWDLNSYILPSLSPFCILGKMIWRKKCVHKYGAQLRESNDTLSHQVKLGNLELYVEQETVPTTWYFLIVLPVLLVIVIFGKCLV